MRRRASSGIVMRVAMHLRGVKVLIQPATSYAPEVLSMYDIKVLIL